EKARNAYLQQYEIAQRSLLDLLNSENELYSARRARANARYDLSLACFRTHAGMSQLGTLLGIAPPQTEPARDKESVGDDAASRCPADVVDVHLTDRATLNSRAAAEAAKSGKR